ncbi:MAG: hypothetical protein SGARI_003265 [Bacillariaceae sp.]
MTSFKPRQVVYLCVFLTLVVERFLVVSNLHVCLVQDSDNSSKERDEYVWKGESTLASRDAQNERNATTRDPLAVIQPFKEDEQSEYPLRLTCPGYQLDTTNYSVGIAFHVGLQRNWRTIARDQLNTVMECGLGHAISTMIVTTMANPDSQDTVEDVQQIILNEFPVVATKATYYTNLGIPFEGTAMNQLKEFCSLQEKPAAVFYFHTKGTSHYDPNFRNMDKPRTYSQVVPQRAR